MALPYAWWLHEACNYTVHVSSCGDTSPLWWFATYTLLPCLRGEAGNRRVCSPSFGWVSDGEPSCHRGRSLVPGLTEGYLRGLRSRVLAECASVPRPPSRSVVFVLNKHASEWGKGPVNHIHPSSLTPLLPSALLLYHRADRHSKEQNRPTTHLGWPVEREWLLRSGVRDLSDGDAGWTLAKQLCHMSQADSFLVSQGGGSRIAALFRKPTVVLHRKGSDDYDHIRRFASNPKVVAVRELAPQSLLPLLLFPPSV